jgi:hypothetical protein
MFMISVGPLYTSNAIETATSEQDFWDVQWAAWGVGDAPARTRLLERYPDLRSLNLDARGATLARKWKYDALMGLHRGVAFGLAFCLSFFTALGSVQAMVAGVARDRSRGPIGTTLRFYEMSIPAALVIGVSMVRASTLLGGSARSNAPTWFDLVVIVIAGLAVAAAYYQKRWWVRLPAQLGWLLLYLGAILDFIKF